MENENSSADFSRGARRESRVYEQINDAPLPVLRVDSNGVIIWANEALCRLLGYNTEDIEERNVCDFYFDPAVCLALLRLMKSQGIVENHESVLRCSDGSAKVVLINANYFSEDGREKYIRCYVTDITGRSQSERLNTKMIQQMPVGVYAVNNAGQIIYYNDVAAQLWGHAPRLNADEHRYFPFCSLHLPDGTFIAAEENPLTIALLDGRNFSNLELTVKRSNGTSFPVLINIELMTDQEGRTSGAIVVFQDMSEWIV